MAAKDPVKASDRSSFFRVKPIRFDVSEILFGRGDRRRREEDVRRSAKAPIDITTNACKKNADRIDIKTETCTIYPHPTYLHHTSPLIRLQLRGRIVRFRSAVGRKRNTTFFPSQERKTRCLERIVQDKWVERALRRQ